MLKFGVVMRIFAETIINSLPARYLLGLFSFANQVGSLKKDYHFNSRILDTFFDSLVAEKMSVSLDLGCGPMPRNPFRAETVHGADIRENKEKNVVFADFTLGVLPFESASVDYITAYDLLEHIPRAILHDGRTEFPLVSLLNEVFRVLKPDGMFFCVQPCFPFKQAFQDPTHVNIMTEDTLFNYFCEPAWARIYGYEGSFEMIKDGWISDKYFSFMRKSRSEPMLDLGFTQGA